MGTCLVAVMLFSKRPENWITLMTLPFCLCLDWFSLLLGFHGNPGTCSLWLWHSIRVWNLQSEDPRWMAGMWAMFLNFVIKYFFVVFCMIYSLQTFNMEFHWYPLRMVDISEYCHSSPFACKSREPASVIPHQMQSIWCSAWLTRVPWKCLPLRVWVWTTYAV